MMNNLFSLASINSADLIGSWNFDEGSGSILFDHSGREHHGSLHGTSWIQGVNNTALHFNGQNSYVEIPNSDDFNGFTEFSISFWFYIDSFDTFWEPLINKGYTNEWLTDVFEINVDKGGFISFILNFETSGRQTYTTPPGTVTTGKWYHLVGSFDGDYLYLYLNGKLAAKHDVFNEPLKTSNASLFIGVEYEYPPESYLNGAIDELNLFTHSIDYNEVLELYKQRSVDSFSQDLKLNHGMDRSPLRGVIPKQFIPVVATFITLITINFWNLFGNIITEFISDYTSERIIDFKATKKNIAEKLDRISVPYLPFKVSELFNLLIVVLVFSAAMSWTWSDDLNEILGLFLINFIIIGFIYTFREIFRIYYSNKHKIETNHIFWPFGAILTLISTVLGNTFSLASYITAENEGAERYARMLFQINLIFYILSLFCFMMYLIVSHVMLQMIFIFCIMMIMIDMTPIKPLDGALIRKWNPMYWLGLYSVVTISYIIMNFNLYI